MQNNTRPNEGYYESQEQPPYQPPPMEDQYQPPPYQQPYPPSDYGPQPPLGMPPETPPDTHYKSSPIPIVAGILLLIVAIQGFITGGALFIGGEFVEAYSDYPGMGTLADILKICGIIFIILAIIIIIGAVSSFTKKSWGLALVGSVIGIFTIGYYFTGTLLSIIALILIAISKDEFI